MVTADEMRSIMGAIWEELADGGVAEPPTADDLHQPRDGAALAGRPRLVGRVEITGKWEGAVTIDCDAELTARIAGAMFGVPGGTSEPEEIRDALGELANMAGASSSPCCRRPRVSRCPPSATSRARGAVRRRCARSASTSTACGSC